MFENILVALMAILAIVAGIVAGRIEKFGEDYEENLTKND